MRRGGSALVGGQHEASVVDRVGEGVEGPDAVDGR